MKRSVAAIHIAVILGLPCFAQASATVCLIENARYALMGDQDFTAGFDIRPTALTPQGELTLFVKSAKSQFTYWFRLNFGNGYSTLSMTPLRQSSTAPNVGRLSDIQSEPTPLDDFQPLFLINQDLSFLPPEAARSGLPSPAYLFPASLGPSLWYNSARFGNPQNTRESMIRGLFKFTNCDRR